MHLTDLFHSNAHPGPGRRILFLFNRGLYIINVLQGRLFDHTFGKKAASGSTSISQ
jgi:hypothetical protein